MDIKPPEKSDPKNIPSLEFIVPPVVNDKPTGGMPHEPKASAVLSGIGWHSWRAIGIIIAGFSLLVLGAYLIYLFAVKNVDDKPAREIVVPPPPEGVKDGDNDGLTDAKEDEVGTNAKKADSDGDGLADGDEVNVYLSDPLLYDTDSDGFDDGQEPANGYSPIRSSMDKADSSEVQGWTDRIAKYGLHEPTNSTLKLKATPTVEAKPTIYNNSLYKYSVELPPLIAAREEGEGREVGFYVTGTKPDDEEVLTDPISIAAAVKIPNQSLKDLATGLYATGTFESLTELKINNVNAVKLARVEDEICAKDVTLLEGEDVVLLFTRTCADDKLFADIYDKIVASFKFTE